MSDEQDPERDVRHYDYSVHGKAVEPDKEPDDCRACGGTGKLLLLVSARSCEACEGTGKVAADGAHDPAAAVGTWQIR
jgi:DnaJ-class molecular chaperone